VILIKLENDFYLVQLDDQTGAVTGLLDKAARIELIAEPRLAETFRLLLPLEDLEAHYLLGTEQAPPEIDRTISGVILRWEGPLTSACGSFSLAVTGFIDFVGPAVQFRIVVENQTRHRLAEVWHAALGGIIGLGEREDTKVLIPEWGRARYDNLFQNFPESMGIGGGGGLRFPEYYAEYPRSLSMPWLDIYNERIGRGLYYACHDELPRVTALRLEMHPGLARKRASGNWPTRLEIAAQQDTYPPGVVMNWVHLPYTAPGGCFSGPTVVLCGHAGDWHAAAGIYREWFAAHFPLPRPQTRWLRGQQAVQDAMFLLPEGNIMLTFRQIPQWAREAAACGVKTVMISGWNVGGHDNQYPTYSPDPRLGTWDDLAQAIAECHHMDIRVLFFANIQSVDTSTDWYRQDLHRYRVMSAKDAAGTAGWGMGTLGARMGYTCPPCGNCDPAFDAYRRIIVDQMRKLAEIGADGIHFDKVGGGGMDFNPALTRGPDQAHPGGILQCLEQTLEACRALRPDFGLSVESHWDRLLSYCDAWWLWHDEDHVPAMKFTFPEFFPTFTVAQPWDYVNVNRAIQYGYQLLVGPVRYSASLADPQYGLLSAYIRESLRIREELKDTILFGEFLDDRETRVTVAEHLTFKTHRNPATGRRACVLVSHGPTPLRTSVAFDGNDAGQAEIQQPFAKAQAYTLSSAMEIPPERFLIVVEQ
jgi:hypothetical protein